MMNLSFKNSLIFWLIPLVLILLWNLRMTILPFVVGFIIGISVQTIAIFLTHKLKINYYFNVFLIFLLFAIIFAVFVYSTIQVISYQIPQFLEKATPFLEKMTPYFKSFGIQSRNLEALINNLSSLSLNYLTDVLSFINKLFYSLFSFILIVVVSIYTALWRNLVDDISKIFPEEKRDEYLRIFLRIKRKLSFWFFGQIILMLVVGLAVYLTMVIMQIPYATLIGLGAGLLEIIPIAGPILSFLLASIITLIEKPEMIFWIAMAFILIQQLENHFLVPLVMKKTTTLNPLLVIFGMIIGGHIGGILGIISVIPILVIFANIFNQKNYDIIKR